MQCTCGCDVLSSSDPIPIPEQVVYMFDKLCKFPANVFAILTRAECRIARHHHGIYDDVTVPRNLQIKFHT